MSRNLPHSLLPACGLVLAVCAYALCADTPKQENQVGDGFAGEIVLVEVKSGSLVAIEQPRVRTIAGLSFVGGNVFFDDSIPNSGEFVGGRVWVPTGEVSRLFEFDTKAKFAVRQEIPRLLKQKGQLELQLRTVKSEGATHQRLTEELQKVMAALADRAHGSR
jgi:hypothetical protein